MALDLAEQLESQPTQVLRRVAAEAASLAVTRIQLTDPRLAAALAALRKDALSDLPERSKVRKLTAELDEIAWDALDKVEHGILPRQAYDEAFARARASAAVGFALEPDALIAAREAVYEVWHALADPDAVRMAVTNALR